MIVAAEAVAAAAHNEHEVMTAPPGGGIIANPNVAGWSATYSWFIKGLNKPLCME